MLTNSPFRGMLAFVLLNFTVFLISLIVDVFPSVLVWSSYLCSLNRYIKFNQRILLLPLFIFKTYICNSQLSELSEHMLCNLLQKNWNAALPDIWYQVYCEQTIQCERSNTNIYLTYHGSEWSYHLRHYESEVLEIDKISDVSMLNLVDAFSHPTLITEFTEYL